MREKRLKSVLLTFFFLGDLCVLAAGAAAGDGGNNDTGDDTGEEAGEAAEFDRSSRLFSISSLSSCCSSWSGSRAASGAKRLRGRLLVADVVDGVPPP
jgi:hypothetical protein